MLNKIKKPLFTDTVKRIVLWDIAIFFLLFVTSNVFTIVITNKILTDNLDERLKNEVETLLGSFVIRQDSIKFTGYSEIKEPNFTTINSGAFFLQVYSIKDKLLLSSDNLKSFGTITFNIPDIKSKYEFANLTAGNHQLRVIYTPLMNEQNKLAAYLQLSVFRTEYSSIMKKIILFNLLNLPFILLIIVLVSIFLAKKSYSPLNKIISIAENISANNLNARIKYDAHPQDELGRLRDTLNNLFTRLEAQINQISQFTDNASHQLMTPLTAVKTELEYILKRDRAPEEYKETLTMLNVQTDKMISIIKSLLVIAKYSSNTEEYKSVFKISQVINELIKPVFKNQNIDYEIGGDLYLRGSYEGFQIVLENLIDNAIKYSPDKSRVIVRAERVDDNVKISVEDFGTGIIDEEKEKIFEKFYRTASSIKGSVQGYGLGLCLVKTIVLSMEGTIKVEDNLQIGTKFIVSFPLINII
ncbi:MAG: HAMP domain-containing histidine kinase [Bacteroidetes bacterium]|nr:HAMP domain-containing histidine kinase [Bacteroidota bacterium]